MSTHPQYWQARTPLRVRVLGVLFVLLVLVMLGLLWMRWGHSVWVYSAIASGFFVFVIYALGQPAVIQTLVFDESSSEFSLLSDTQTNTLLAIHIVRVWQSAFAITLQIQVKHSNQIKHLTFWRGTLAAPSWRKLHIYLWRYQLQYQLADLKGAQ